MSYIIDQMSLKRKNDEYGVIEWFYNINDGSILCGYCHPRRKTEDEIATDTSKILLMDIECSCCGWSPMRTGILPPNKRFREEGT